MHMQGRFGWCHVHTSSNDRGIRVDVEVCICIFVMFDAIYRGWCITQPVVRHVDGVDFGHRWAGRGHHHTQIVERQWMFGFVQPRLQAMFGVDNAGTINTSAGCGNDNVFAITCLHKNLWVGTDGRIDFGVGGCFITTAPWRKKSNQVADPLLDWSIAGKKMPLHAHDFVDLLSEGALCGRPSKRGKSGHSCSSVWASLRKISIYRSASHAISWGSPASRSASSNSSKPVVPKVICLPSMRLFSPPGVT